MSTPRTSPPPLRSRSPWWWASGGTPFNNIYIYTFVHCLSVLSRFVVSATRVLLCLLLFSNVVLRRCFSLFMIYGLVSRLYYLGYVCINIIYIYDIDNTSLLLYSLSLYICIYIYIYIHDMYIYIYIYMYRWSRISETSVLLLRAHSVNCL